MRGRVVGVLPSGQAVDFVVDTLELGGFDHAQFGGLAPEEALNGRSSSDVAKLPVQSAWRADRRRKPGSARRGLFWRRGVPRCFHRERPCRWGSRCHAGGSNWGLGRRAHCAWLSRDTLNIIRDQLARGGLVLWIVTRNAKQEDEAVEALPNAAAGATAVQASLESGGRGPEPRKRNH